MTKVVANLDAAVLPPIVRVRPNVRGTWSVRLTEWRKEYPVDVFVTGTPEQLRNWAARLSEIVADIDPPTEETERGLSR